ncbi:hypothetical protein KIN20_027787 [Parelaphostrongylus tenuis]|uniref:Uncharacterized protein n=1 Tax=Parelaphostrongylus tenuis TaxID=148309 RepID=A0AAD5WE72_PARTN|nr:hypothetical protein KIN20_027787 [Parelaphostrongylus tenuis]
MVMAIAPPTPFPLHFPMITDFRHRKKVRSHARVRDTEEVEHTVQRYHAGVRGVKEAVAGGVLAEVRCPVTTSIHKVHKGGLIHRLKISTMDHTYDDLLQQIEQEMDQILYNFKLDEKNILENIKQLKAVESQSTSTTTVLVREIDKQLGGFYGSLELRDGLKEAHAKMNAVVTVLKRVREFVSSQFIRLQIQQLQENISLLQNVFVRMNERMELPDSDELFNEALSDTGNSERLSVSCDSAEPSKAPPK